MQKELGWKKRPCRICGRWFVPDPRLKDRQKTCADAQLQKGMAPKKVCSMEQRQRRLLQVQLSAKET